MVTKGRQSRWHRSSQCGYVYELDLLRQAEEALLQLADDRVGHPQLLSDVSLAVIVQPPPAIVAGVECDFAHRLAEWGQDGIEYVRSNTP